MDRFSELEVEVSLDEDRFGNPFSLPFSVFSASDNPNPWEIVEKLWII
jgi:hypothetical protein